MDTIQLCSEYINKADNKFKGKLTTAPILGDPDYNQEFIVETDSSIGCFGEMLSQRNNK